MGFSGGAFLMTPHIGRGKVPTTQIWGADNLRQDKGDELQLVFCNVTQNSPDSTTLTLCPRTMSWEQESWEYGVTHVPSSQGFLPSFLSDWEFFAGP